jgi:hypothetical protein
LLFDEKCYSRRIENAVARSSLRAFGDKIKKKKKKGEKKKKEKEDE